VNSSVASTATRDITSDIRCCLMSSRETSQLGKAEPAIDAEDLSGNPFVS
jgi:hypothetical protein